MGSHPVMIYIPPSLFDDPLYPPYDKKLAIVEEASQYHQQ